MLLLKYLLEHFWFLVSLFLFSNKGRGEVNTTIFIVINDSLDRDRSIDFTELMNGNRRNRFSVCFLYRG